MADDADHLLPGLDLGMAQFGCHVPQQDQFVLPPIEPEQTPGNLMDILAVLVSDGEQTIATAFKGFAYGTWHLGQHGIQKMSLQLASPTEQTACSQIAQHHAVRRVQQQHRHRRVLYHGIEQQLTLHQIDALRPQGVAQRVMGLDQIGQIGMTIPVDAKTEIAIAIGIDSSRQGTKQGSHRHEAAPDDQPGQYADSDRDDRCRGPW